MLSILLTVHPAQRRCARSLEALTSPLQANVTRISLAQLPTASWRPRCSPGGFSLASLRAALCPVVHVSDGSVRDSAGHRSLLGRWVLLGAAGSSSAVRAANKPSLPTPLPAPSPPRHEHGAKNVPRCRAPASLAKQTNYQPRTSHDKRLNVYPSPKIPSKTKATFTPFGCRSNALPSPASPREGVLPGPVMPDAPASLLPLPW